MRSSFTLISIALALVTCFVEASPLPGTSDLSLFDRAPVDSLPNLHVARADVGKRDDLDEDWKFLKRKERTEGEKDDGPNGDWEFLKRKERTEEERKDDDPNGDWEFLKRDDLDEDWKFLRRTEDVV
ncbi:hypothetical protein SCHPADRAFT_703228 [Schizopora paradoxa]|uniref:Uncharacterized protein n=1 Tax=Schizopora paradoxa TaxID=27342 RepID=A0A0H2R2P1_9AGAM|nr:hypothetical protein SCHPADRAFT_703228 [Schizopora paradoxa]